MADPIRILSLFSGSGMHDEAVRVALEWLGFASRVLGYVEREASAAAWLMGRMEAQAVEPAPVFAGDLSDLAGSDLADMRGRIDIIVASPPCQPYSSAGKRLGNADDRSHGGGDGPLPHTIRIIEAVRPALVWFENVQEWVTGGHFRPFGSELCGLGYDIQSPLFVAAEDVGAPHQRERVYILCALADAGGERERADTNGGDCAKESQSWRSVFELAERTSRRRGIGWQPSGGDGFAGGGDEELGYADGRGRRTQGDSGQQSSGLDWRGGELADSERPEPRPGEAGEQGGAGIGRGGHSDAGDGVPLYPPGRNDYRRWAALAAGGLDPALMPAVERGFSALADGLAFSNSDLLRLGGNGVVPLAAAAAFVHAFERLTNERQATA